MKILNPLLAAASALFATASAGVIGHCPVQDKFCMSIGVPESSAASGSGNIYFQVQSVADQYSWVAVGTGTIMSGSNIFVFYTDGAGNVTVSTRRGTGHTLPQPQSDTRVQLLAGSGVANGIMTANVLCQNCESWSGGQMDLQGKSSAWIAAWREGSPLNTQSADARITQHQDTDTFRIDLTQATVTQDANPFVTGAAAGTGNNGNTNSGNNSGTGAGNNGGIGVGNTGGTSSTSGSGPDMLLIHGVIMTAAFALLYPLGSILIVLVRKWYFHVACQVVAFIAMWAGFGTGYTTARNTGTLFKDGHTIFGTVVVSAMVLQPILGSLHHHYFKKNGTRSPVSYAHIWYGRVLMLLGIVNGGVGLRAAGSPQTFTIVYAVIAAMSGVAYVACALVAGMRKGGGSGAERSKEDGSYSPNSATADFGPNRYGYQTGQGADTSRNQQYQFQSRGRGSDEQYGWTR
ncbi:related to cellobiose dehydrogenase [Cephalotrichum gorgonifer]|uniref:Related to cellobiose dehydrogenase n=1 Tax=Cephalotrichum gorgonifer TaxID=2041049 RepID=A0AAE8SR49_9PEZI|nr:related to cellobiose dehydrogenase [Cephalotrichum gorgonifer]